MGVWLVLHAGAGGVGGAGTVIPLIVSAAEKMAVMGPTWAFAAGDTARVAVPAVAVTVEPLAAALAMVMAGAMGVGNPSCARMVEIMTSKASTLLQPLKVWGSCKSPSKSPGTKMPR